MAVKHSLYDEEGIPMVEEGKCTRCGRCARICPAEVLALVDDKISVRKESYFGCIACGHCMMVCPTGSITVRGRGVSAEDLRPLPPSGERAGADSLYALMLSRRSVRRFREREVEPELLQRIVDMATTAPMGIPPWDLGCVTVQGRLKVQELAGEIVKGYAGMLKIFRPWLLAAMRPLIGREKYEQFRYFVRPLAQSYVETARQGRDTLFWDAPALLVFYHSPYSDPVEAAIACTYAMLAAESLGLGSTMIGGAPPVMQRNRKLCLRFGIPTGYTPALALIVGYPATSFVKGIKRSFVSTDIVS